MCRVFLFHLFHFFSYCPFPNLILNFLGACLSQAINYVGLNLTKANVRSPLVNSSLSKLYPSESLALWALKESLRKTAGKILLSALPLVLQFAVRCHLTNTSTLGSCHIVSHFLSAQMLPDEHVTKGF